MVLQTGSPIILLCRRRHGTEGTDANLTSYTLYYENCFRIETVLAEVKLELIHSLKTDERTSTYLEYPLR